MAGERDRDPRRVPRRVQEVPEIAPRGPRRTGAGGTGRGGISEARAYTPRGRTVRETGPARSSDSDRPALRLVAGGPAEPSTAEESRTPRARSTTPGTAASRKAATAGGPLKAGRAKAAGGGRPAAVKASAGPKSPSAGKPAATRPAKPRRLFSPGKRLRAGTAILLLVFVVLAGRMVQLQLTDGRAYAAEGLKDRLKSVSISAPRGSILDRDGNVLAQSVDAYYVYADPTQVKNPLSTATALRTPLGIPVSELLPLLSSKVRPSGEPDQFEYLARGVSSATEQQVRALDLPGIQTAPDQKRDDPGGELAANLIGFTGADMHGLGGLEAAYDKVLSGTDGKHTFEVGIGDLMTQLPGGYDETNPARPGTTLQLTIDRDLQYEIQQMLYEHMSKAKADWGAAIVMKVGTGEILAQASYPTFDVQQWQQAPTASRIDAATQVTVDAGSVAKIITFTGALQEGVITPNSTVTIGPSIKKGDTTFRDTHPLPSGTKITLPGILGYSSNVGTITVASELGAEKLYEYQKLLGFGKPSGEGLPGESGGLVQPPSRWSGSSYGSIPIGMGISVTPLQMTAAYQTLANNGVYVAPHLIKAEITPAGKTIPAAAPESHFVLSPQNAQALRTAFEAVTSPDGTGHSAAITGYRVSGKTGTGLQVKDGKYEPGTVASFVGMAPADNPQYVIGVFTHVPVGSGGGTAGPTFHDMMTFTLQHFQVPPTGTKAPKFRFTAK
jgi:cell division protein FtsI (penicillin-binding protein 3)